MLMSVNYFVGAKGSGLAKRIMCGLNYLIALGYACYQFQMYRRYLQGFPDEQAHVSYIVSLKEVAALFLISLICAFTLMQEPML